MWALSLILLLVNKFVPDKGKKWIDARLDLMVRTQLYEFNTGKIKTLTSSDNGNAIIWRRPVVRGISVIKRMLDPQLIQLDENISNSGVWIQELDELTDILKLEKSVSQSHRGGVVEDPHRTRKQRNHWTKRKTARIVRWCWNRRDAVMEDQVADNPASGSGDQHAATSEPALEGTGRKRKRLPNPKAKKKSDAALQDLELQNRLPDMQSGQTEPPASPGASSSATVIVQNIYLNSEETNQLDNTINMDDL